MNQIEHQIYLRNPTGDLLDIIVDGYYAGLSYTLKDGEPGVLDLTLPGNYDTRNLKTDGLIEIMRSVSGGPLILEGGTSFFIRRVAKQETQDGVEVISVVAVSALNLMQRRIVAYAAGTSYTEKVSIPWDNMMRQIVRENYGALATDVSRNLIPWLDVELDHHAGAVTDHACAWAGVYDTLSQIVNDVRNTGLYCTFDVLRTGTATFQFVVFIGSRGIDHTSDASVPVVISKERGNLTVPYHDDDWQNEKNFVYATGQGLESDREVQTAHDDVRIGISPFNRQEFQQEARTSKIAASVLAEAQAALESHRPARNFSGTIVQTTGCTYGVDWTWGDVITAEYDGLTFDCYVTTVSVSIDSTGAEIVSGQLRSVTDVT